MKNLPPSHSPRRDHGVALVLVLCFVVLVTGLVVAYFSRTLNTRQLSNASTSTEQAEQLANSATDVILGDFKQEIADPTASTASTPPPAALPAGQTVYFPTAGKYAVPLRNATQPNDPIPNLVRYSVRTDPMTAPAVASRASAASSTTLSANGRSVSLTRWNRHYLIPTAADPGPSPTLAASKPITAFTAPDWVFVTAEKGPEVLNNPKSDASGTVTPIGRYAYAIYDEGGLLDINHTGYPSVSSLGHIGSKFPPSYADLTQLPAAGAAPLTSTIVDNLLAWRNFATLQASGGFPTLLPSPAPDPSPDSAYYNLFASGTTSLLQVASAVYNGKTDQMFLSRQQLIGYFAAAGLDPTYLQYLGTFSRSLNQPSYAPEANRPLVVPLVSGGNDSAGVTGITPNFLTARVVNPFQNPNLSNSNTRYDGTPVVTGEPLVKKRFPLNRLAWLTYQGPSAMRNTAATALTGNDADIGYLKQYGITKEWLDQGSADNIKTYFGLTYGANPNNADGTPAGSSWTYVHNNGGAILNINNPSKATDVARQNPGREPDFFELLKAAINPGSIAKTSLAPSVLSEAVTNAHAAHDQFNQDTSLDRAILQIGANIIDQFDTDGCPTRINYNLGSSTTGTVVFGDENLPYISRVRAGLIHLVESNPLETTINPGTDPVTGGIKPLLNTGVGALMNYPEIWNLHDWSNTNATALQQSVGAVAPSQFKVYATTNPNAPIEPIILSTWDVAAHHESESADVAKSPGFQDTYHFRFNPPEARYLAESNTRMTFTITPTDPTSEALFREPTILYIPGMPTNSQLASNTLYAGNVGSASSPGLDGLASNPSFFGPAPGNGLKSAASASPSPLGDGVPVAGQAYVGFYLGAQPLRFWTDGSGNSTPPTNSPVYQTEFGPVSTNSNAQTYYDVVYTLACQDPNTMAWIPYDTKELTTTGAPNANLQSSLEAGFGLNGAQSGANTGDLDFGARYYQTIDPRTSRFGMLDPYIHDNANSIPPRRGMSAVNLLQGIMKTDREGVDSGTALFAIPLLTEYFTSSMGWYPGGLVVQNNNNLRPGLLTQNNPHAYPDSIIAPGLPSDYAASATSPLFYSDPDGVIRRASGGNVDAGTGTAASTITGLPMAYPSSSGTDPGYSGTTASQMDSRPSILNRPFRSVAELGYVFSGTPWKNLDFFLPESGDSALLDVFCVNDNSDGNALTAGQVNLNTHQVPVLQAILAQAGRDQWNDANVIPGGVSAQAQQLAQLLVTRTVTTPTSGPNAGNGPQPLLNVSDLVGRWIKTAYLPTGGIDGSKCYDGFAQDLAAFLDAAATSNQQMHNIQRFGEGAVRALSNAGQTRVWNLMFDIVAQTGRFGTQATTLDQFNVEGEQHYWVHVAIDRYTGQILDKQVEVVKE